MCACVLILIFTYIAIIVVIVIRIVQIAGVDVYLFLLQEIQFNSIRFGAFIRRYICTAQAYMYVCMYVSYTLSCTCVWVFPCLWRFLLLLLVSKCCYWQVKCILCFLIAISFELLLSLCTFINLLTNGKYCKKKIPTNCYRISIGQQAYTHFLHIFL